MDCVVFSSFSSLIGTLSCGAGRLQEDSILSLVENKPLFCLKHKIFVEFSTAVVPFLVVQGLQALLYPIVDS